MVERARPMSLLISSGHFIAGAPPNGLRLSCGLRAPRSRQSSPPTKTRPRWCRTQTYKTCSAVAKNSESPRNGSDDDNYESRGGKRERPCPCESGGPGLKASFFDACDLSCGEHRDLVGIAGDNAGGCAQLAEAQGNRVAGGSLDCAAGLEHPGMRTTCAVRTRLPGGDYDRAREDDPDTRPGLRGERGGWSVGIAGPRGE